MNPRRMAALLALSGLAALVVETVWMRWLRLLLGATAPAASATLVAFFAGHGLGAAWAARRARLWDRPLATYGRVELGAAAGALAMPLLLRACEALWAPAYDGLSESPGVLTALRFGVAAAATLPAAFCFGASFPAAAAAALGGPASLGRGGAALYAANVAGATLGTAATAFLALEWLGIPGTYAGAALLSAGVGVVALGLSRGRAGAVARAAGVGEGGAGAPALGAARAERRRREREARRAEGGRRRRSARRDPGRFEERGWTARGRGPLFVAAVSGLGAVALQVLVVHAFAQVLNQSVYAFGAVLAVVLAAGALGAAAVSLLERATALDPRTTAGVSLALAAVAAAAFPAWIHGRTDGLTYLGAGPDPGSYVAAALALVAATAGPVLLAASLVLPASFAWAARSAAARTGPGAGDGAAGVGGRLGALVAVNTAGAVVGALLAPYVLLDRAGLWGAFAVLAGIYAVAAVALPDRTPTRRWRRDLLLGAGWVVVMVTASPLEVPLVRLAPGERLLHAESTPEAVVAVVERDGERLLRIDNHYALGGTAERVHEERQGHLPLLLRPDAAHAAFVGTATGITAGAALAHPVERLRLVELVPAVALAGARFFADANRGVYLDPRARVVLDDARNHLRLTRARFDAVVSDLFVPWRAGTASLYTRDHFRAVRDRLEPGGVFAQWLPLYQLSGEEVRIVLATFADVFPDAAVFRGDFYGAFPIVALVGWKGAPPDPAAIDAAALRLRAAGETDRWVTHPDGVWSLYVGPLAALAPDLAAVPRQTDAHPRLEWIAARSHTGGAAGKRDAFTGLAWARVAGRLAAAAGGPGDPVFPGLGPRRRKAIAGGRALQEAGAFFAAGRNDAAAARLAEAETLLAPELVARAPADPSAAEVWRDDGPARRD